MKISMEALWRLEVILREVKIVRRSMDLRMDKCSPGKYNSSMVFPMANLKYSDKHNMVAFLKKPNESVGFTEVVDFLKASINSKEYIITEASVRSKLQLTDATGIHNLSDAEIYVGLATLGYVTEVGLATAAYELSPTLYLGPKAKHNLFRGGKQAPGLSAPWSAEGSSKDGNEVGSGMGKSYGVPDGGVSALVWESMICGCGE
ncbi:hypothetical protein Tco_0693549 [Tanacetum coccineum]